MQFVVWFAGLQMHGWAGRCKVETRRCCEAAEAKLVMVEGEVR